MSTDRRWGLLAVLLLMLLPASSIGRMRPSTHPPEIALPETIPTETETSTVPPVIKPPVCLASGEVVLRLSRIGIRCVGDNVVDSLRVKELHLDNNEITEVSCGAFNKIPFLETLNLTSNNISTNRLLYFGKHAGLRRLIVDDNKRWDPKNSVLDTFHESLPNLWELSLKRSFITVFSVSLAEFAPNLGRLSLSGNEIESTEFLKNAPMSLKYLDLSKNKIYKMCASLPNSLLELTVDGNMIKELCAENCDESSSLCLHNLNSLMKLNASRNAIATVQANAFQSLSNLIMLDLSGNEIQELHETLWHQTRLIQELYLANNKLTSVPELCRLHKLLRLDLSGNFITSLHDENICNTLRHLQVLVLKDNRILNVNGAAFRKFIGLRALDLSGNELTTVPSYLINSTSLELLLIKRNKINTLKDLAEEPGKLKELHLQDNPLLFIHTSWINWYNLPHLKIILKDRSIEKKIENENECKPTTPEDEHSW